MSELVDDPHVALWSPSSLTLGEVHWYLLKAANVMSSRMTKSHAIEGSRLTRAESTAFGREVGQDDLGWWIAKKEPIHDEFRRRTDATLEAVQRLKTAAVGLKTREIDSYSELILAFREMADVHAAEIEQLHGCVLWLHARDVLAPIICSHIESGAPHDGQIATLARTKKRSPMCRWQ